MNANHAAAWTGLIRHQGSLFAGLSRSLSTTLISMGSSVVAMEAIRSGSERAAAVCTRHHEEAFLFRRRGIQSMERLPLQKSGYYYSMEDHR